MNATSSSDRPDRPLANTYWVVPGRFLAGEYPGATYRQAAADKLRTLLRAGIDHFIDLTQRRDRLAPYAEMAAQEAGRLGMEVVHEPHPIVDLGVPRRRTGHGAHPRRHRCRRWLTAGTSTCTVGAASAGPAPSSAAGSCATAGRVTRRWPRSPNGGRTWRRATSTPSRHKHTSSAATSAAGPNRPGGAPVTEAAVRDRFRGCLLGLAAGDALGTTLEFKRPGTFEPIVTWSAAGRSTCSPANGPTTPRWPCAWPRASSSVAGSTPWTRWSATCAGWARATCPRRGPASTPGPPHSTRWQSSSGTRTPTPARPTRTPPATVR